MLFSKLHEFIPKSYLYLRNGYTFAIFKKDFIAGVTVAVIALPLAMAFAIASGIDPARGLYTAIIAGFLISLLGGSRVQIGGPTGAFVVIIYDIVQRTGYSGLCISTLLAAIILILLGIFRIGSWIKYIPHPLVTGFTTGIAVLIFSTQIKDFFGIQTGPLPSDFTEKWLFYFHAFPTFDPITLSLAATTLIIILLIRRFVPYIPWGISAIVLATLVCWIFQIPVDTIQSRFGLIPRTLPTPSLSFITNIPTENIKELFTDAITIAFLGGIESLLSAVIGDGMIGGKHRSNCELVAQGIANFGSILFGGIPATGAIARTATNVKTGAQTPVAGIIHAVILLLILYCFSPIVSQIPLAALSAVLMMIAWNMSEVGHFSRLLKAPIGDKMVLLTAFFLTVFVDITVAISAGMVLASLVFMQQMSQMSKTISLSQIFSEKPTDFPEKGDTDNLSVTAIPSDVEIYEIQGPFFFGTANILKDLSPSQPPKKTFILRLRSVPMIDASGMYALKEFYHQCHKNGTRLYLSEVHRQTKHNLKQFGLIDLIGNAKIFPDLDSALKNL